MNREAVMRAHEGAAVATWTGKRYPVSLGAVATPASSESLHADPHLRRGDDRHVAPRPSGGPVAQSGGHERSPGLIKEEPWMSR